MRRWRCWWCITVTVAVALSACGSTAPPVRTTGAARSELGEPLAANPDVTQVGGAPGDSRDGAAVGKATASTTATARGRTSSASSSVGATGRGITPTTLTIGVGVPTGTAAVADALGITGAGTVSPENMVNALVDDVNRSGGVLGRKLAVYFHRYDTAEAISNPAKTLAEICADFRDDHKVFAVLINIGEPTLRDCLAAMGSPLIIVDGFGALMRAATYAEHGGNYLYGVTAITTERLAQLFIKSLTDRAFFTPWNTATGDPVGGGPVKLGVIHVDTADQNALYADYAKELAKYGLKFAETVTYAQDLQSGLATTSSAILRFRSAGVTHVFGASAFFLQGAESQRYRPRYAYLPGFGSIGVANAPAAQMKGALTVGWTPASDVLEAQDPGDTPAAKPCRAVMQAHNLSTANREDWALMSAVCDAVYAFRAAATAGREPSVAGLRRGYESLGRGFATAFTFGALLGPNRHYGVDSVRDMAFNTACGCLEFTSKTDRS